MDGRIWSPTNFAPDAQPEVTLRAALAHSYNLATIDLALQVGLERIVRTATDFGFSTDFKPYPSLALGAFEVVPLELARAYCTFAANGVEPYPMALKELVDEHGRILTRKHMQIRSLTTPAKAFLITSFLWSAVEEGTGRSLKELGIRFPVAGKTGTTNDFHDAWFVGYTPDVLALIWVGFDDGTSINATGAQAALPIWADLMKRLPQFSGGHWFTPPPGLVQATVCSQSRDLAVEGACPEPTVEFFLESNVPQQTCRLHGFHPLKAFLRSIANDARY